MSAVSLPFEPRAFSQKVPRPIRVRGGVRATFLHNGIRTNVTDLQERDGYRMRFPRGPACEGVILNTGGGVVAGDHVTHGIDLGERTEVTITTPAAERIYRSDGEHAKIDVTIKIGADAHFSWLPQETILYDNARLARRLDVDMVKSASLTMVEITVFGRKAMREVVASGAYSDHWRVRRAGRLAFAENIRFEGPLAELLSRRAIGNGANMLATVLYVAPDAENRLAAVRTAIDGADCAIGASAWNGLLCIRALGTDLESLRRALARAIVALREQAMPRVWWT